MTVATDVLPLLVHACSEKCILNLPEPAQGYVNTPHQGGLGLEQPAPDDNDNNNRHHRAPPQQQPASLMA